MNFYGFYINYFRRIKLLRWSKNCPTDKILHFSVTRRVAKPKLAICRGFPRRILLHFKVGFHRLFVRLFHFQIWPMRRKWPINKWDTSDMIWPGYQTDTLVWLSRLWKRPRKIKSAHAIFKLKISPDKVFSMTFSMAFFKTYFSLVSVQKSASRVSAATEATRVDKSNFFAIFVTLDISRFCQNHVILWIYPLKYLLACSSDLQFVFSLH